LMDLQTLLEAAYDHPRMISVNMCGPFKGQWDDGRWWITFTMEHDQKCMMFKNQSLSRAKEMAETYLEALPRTLLPEEPIEGITDQEILDLPPFAAED